MPKKVGDTVTGWDVTNGGYCTGTVVEVIPPRSFTGQYGYRYKIDTGETYPDTGKSITRIVQ